MTEGRVSSGLLGLDDAGYAVLPPASAFEHGDPVQRLCTELEVFFPAPLLVVNSHVFKQGDEYLAVVALRERDDPQARVRSSTARHHDPRLALANATLTAVISDADMFELALPRLVETDKIRSAVVTRGNTYRHYGQSEDVVRLQALAESIEDNGALIASTPAGIFSLLRLPGAHLAASSQSEAGAAWLDIWFSHLIEAHRRVTHSH